MRPRTKWTLTGGVILPLGLLSHVERVVHFDAEISHGFRAA
jgi:hypothetical protein